MPRHEIVEVPKGGWVELTNANAIKIGFQVKSPNDVLIAGTVDDTAPTDAWVSWIYGYKEGERNVPLEDLFPGIGANRVFAFCQHGVAKVMVSHA